MLVVTVLLFSSNALAVTKIKLGVATKPGSAQNIAAEKFKELPTRLKFFSKFR